MNNSMPDANIPILTEIISALPTEPTRGFFLENTVSEEATVEVSSAYQLNDVDRRELELALNERVLRQVQARIDFVFEHRIRDSLADALQTSIEALTAEIKRGLQQTLEEVISRAISQELVRLQSQKK